MKAIQNFRDHPSCKYDDKKLICVIDSKLYLLCEDVNQIIPLSIEYTNLGDPFAQLARLNFFIDNKEDSIDIPMYKLQDLINMVKSINNNIPISKELNKFRK